VVDGNECDEEKWGKKERKNQQLIKKGPLAHFYFNFLDLRISGEKGDTNASIRPKNLGRNRNFLTQPLRLCPKKSNRFLGVLPLCFKSPSKKEKVNATRKKKERTDSKPKTTRIQ